MARTKLGCGTTFYGVSDKDQEPNSFITTEWFVMFINPIVPIRSLRVLSDGSGNFLNSRYYVIEEKFWNIKQVLFTYALTALTIFLSIKLSDFLGNAFTTKENQDLARGIGFMIPMIITFFGILKPKN